MSQPKLSRHRNAWNQLDSEDRQRLLEEMARIRQRPGRCPHRGCQFKAPCLDHNQDLPKGYYATSALMRRSS